MQHAYSEDVRFQSLTPKGVLAPFVAKIWHYEGRCLPHAWERITPDGQLQLLINLDFDEIRWRDSAGLQAVRGAVLGGGFTGPIAIDTQQQRCVTGVSFKPGGAVAFCSLLATELSGTYVPLEDLGMPHLRDEMLAQPSVRARLHLWKNILLNRLSVHVDEPILAGARLVGRGAAVREVAAEVGLSPKQFRRRFMHAVGLPPKRFARIRRLQRVLRANADKQADWTIVAHHFNYHDQAHLIRDFRELTGVTPGSYRARSADDWNHALL